MHNEYFYHNEPHNEAPSVSVHVASTPVRTLVHHHSFTPPVRTLVHLRLDNLIHFVHRGKHAQFSQLFAYRHCFLSYMRKRDNQPNNAPAAQSTLARFLSESAGARRTKPSQYYCAT